MKAKLLDLKGKYYGTIIEIVDDNNNKYEINLWNNSEAKPSVRELKKAELDCTPEQWAANEIVDYKDYEGSGQFTLVKMRAKEALEINDGHYESQATYVAAQQIIYRINSFN